MTKCNADVRLERFNVVLSLQESEWLNQLSAEIQAQTGAQVSRSEIIRAALAGLRELHRRAPLCTRLVPLHTCTKGSDLTALAVLSARLATDPRLR